MILMGQYPVFNVAKLFLNTRFFVRKQRQTDSYQARQADRQTDRDGE